MRHSVTNLSRNLSLVLICAALGACASTQKSGSGPGAAEQSAAPISEASKSNAAGAADSAGASTAAAPAESAATGSNLGSSDAGTGAAATAGSASATDNAPQATSEEAAQLKRQLEDQDSQINKLRSDQQAAAREEEAARQAQEQQAAAASQASQAPAAVAKSSAGQDAAAFPPDANAAGRAAAPVGETTMTAPAGETAAAPAGTLERSVYFDYDQARVPEKYDPMLMANAAYLKAHPSLKTEVQGNCDERGSREYNLALGARRAQAVKRALELAGADGHRIGVVSFGAEKPIALGKDEDSYSKNRRADIVY